jgi:Uma2 family endonuclease
MRCLMLEVPAELLAERRRLGHDLWDEMWEGVLHMVPQPARWHQSFGGKLFAFLLPIAEARGLLVNYETSLYRSDKDYRTPDLVVYHPAQGTERGIEGGAELAIEILSPNDESREKLPFHARFAVREVLLVDPDTRVVELLALREGGYQPVAPDAEGRVGSAVLPVTFATRDGPRFELAGPGTEAAI